MLILLGGSSEPAPDLEDNFSSWTTTTLRNAITAGTDPYSAQDNTNQISIDPDVELAPSTQSLVRTWPPSSASEIEIGYNIDFPVDVDEFWLKYYYRFSSNFSVNGPGGGNQDYKFIFGRLRNASGFRTIIKAGTGGNVVYNAGFPNTGQTGTTPSGGNLGQEEDTYNKSVSSIFDGTDHLIKWHCKRNTTLGVATGIFELEIDGDMLIADTALKYELSGVLAQQFYGVAMGRNLNKGTGAWTQTLHDLYWGVWLEGNPPGWSGFS